MTEEDRLTTHRKAVDPDCGHEYNVEAFDRCPNCNPPEDEEVYINEDEEEVPVNKMYEDLD